MESWRGRGVAGMLVVVAATTGLAAQHRSSLNVRVELTDRVGVPPGQLDALASEVDAIWNRHGIRLEWAPGDLVRTEWPRAGATVRVVISRHGRAPRAHPARQRLASIIFLGPGRPYDVISVSYASALSVVAAAARGVPSAPDLVIGRMLGRAVAHEVGHYLLKSPHHARRGLMRARIPPRELIGNGSDGFGLLPEHRALLAERAYAPRPHGHQDDTHGGQAR